MEAEDLEEAVEPTVRALDSVVALIDRSKETSVPLKGSVWDLVTGNVAGARKFDSMVRDLDDELHEWKDETEKLDRSLREMNEELQAADEEPTTMLSRDVSPTPWSRWRLLKRSPRISKRVYGTPRRKAERSHGRQAAFRFSGTR